MKIATILLEGDAGSGKTQLAKALSADFGLPYTKVTCFADMDKTDVIGAILPVIADEQLARLTPEDREALEALYDSDDFRSATRLLTDKLQLGTEDAALRLKRLLRLASEHAEGDTVEYRFYPSEIVTAYRNGYLLEIQEPTVIRDAAVLMALNSALEPDGSINLPTEVVSRHPDFIAVITTNRGYAGVRPLNESLRDRVQHAERMDLPAKSVMIERAAAKTGFRNLRVLEVLADVILLLDQTARAHAIKGVAGMRSFFYWADAVASGIGVTASLYPKVVYKLTTDPEEIKLLEAALERHGLFAALAEAEAKAKAEAEIEAASASGAVVEQDTEAEAEAAAAHAAKENGEERETPHRRPDSEAVEIHTWGAIEVEADPHADADAEGIALKKAEGSEEGAAGASTESANGESAEHGDNGDPRYHQSDPETMSAADSVKRSREERAQLNRDARASAAESLHSRVKLVVHRPGFDEADIDEYERLSRELQPIVREIARKAMPLLEQEPTSEFARHHAYGSRFQADSVVHRDFNTFAKKKPPTDAPSLAVALRVDESASMAAFGRLDAAKRAVVAVYDFCRMCGIPVMIYGDTADVSRLERMSVFAYADLKRADADDRYRLMGIRARSNNRDGMALRIIADRLSAAPQSAKLLISLSDGQPKAMDDYTGTLAMQDMQQTIAEFERKGVTMLAAAIGQDKEIISRIYGNERFLDMSDLQALPAKLVGLIAKYL